MTQLMYAKELRSTLSGTVLTPSDPGFDDARSMFCHHDRVPALVVRNHGAAFSPAGTHIAFASGGGLGLDETYVIPNVRASPIFIDYLQDAGDAYLLKADTLVDYVLAWLP